jgi:hypothetical protein
LRPDLDSVDTQETIFSEYRGIHRAGIDFYGNFRVGVDAKPSGGSLQKIGQEVCLQNRWRSAADIDRVEGIAKPIDQRHLPYQRGGIGLLQIQVNDRIKIAVSAFMQAKRNVNVQTRSHGVKHTDFMWIPQPDPSFFP